LEQAHKISVTEISNKGSIPGSILKVLAYFDVFNYPLTEAEIYEYCDIKNPDIKFFKMELEQLVTLNIIKKSSNYYYLNNNNTIEKREKANLYSALLLKNTKKYSNLISRFPFVRGICISGSLSKNNADKDADVDYFIITEKNRLWICRTMLALYKKIFLLNSNKYFCINYFVDTAHLEIPDKNIFTATEIAFLIPTYHRENFCRLIASNNWVSEYYPDKKIEFNLNYSSKEPGIKRAIEYFLDNRIGNALDNMLLKTTLIYRKIKFFKMEPAEFANNMRAHKGVSKHHPNSFQEKVIKAYKERLQHIENKFGFTLN
jgi:hypothetical protein